MTIPLQIMNSRFAGNAEAVERLPYSTSLNKMLPNSPLIQRTLFYTLRMVLGQS